MELRSAYQGHSFRLRSQFCHSDTRLNFFSIRVVPVWNALPESVISSPSYSSFRIHLSSCNDILLSFCTFARNLYFHCTFSRMQSVAEDVSNSCVCCKLYYWIYQRLYSRFWPIFIIFFLYSFYARTNKHTYSYIHTQNLACKGILYAEYKMNSIFRANSLHSNLVDSIAKES